MIVSIRGEVSKGLGEGRKFTQLAWFKRQIREKLGFEPYPGTLNIRVSPEEQIVRFLDMFSGIRIQARRPFVSGRVYKALIAGRIHGAIVRPEVPDYPRDILEILAPIDLRENLNLRDGDEVRIKIWLE